MLIFFPTGTREITAHDAFHRQRFRFLYNHRTSGKLFAKRLQILRELFKIRRDKVILDFVETLEPERGNLVEYRALVRDRVGQDHVKSRDAICGDKEQPLPEVENFAHFAAAQLFNSR